MRDINKMSQTYGNESIRALKGAEKVRLRPGVMFGTNDINGAFHGVIEIIGNSLDEARAGYGKQIDVDYYGDGEIAVRDYGRGVPMDWNDNEKRYNWDLVYNELYAGGKYDEDDEDYKYSVGLNGLGATAVQYTSEYFIVESVRDGFKYTMKFEKGIPVDELKKEPVSSDTPTGTYTRWKIDKEVFLDTEFKFSMFLKYCESQAHINAIRFVLRDMRKSNEPIVIEGKGIKEYILSQIPEDKVIDVVEKVNKSSGIEKGKHYNAMCEVAMVFTKETASKSMYFHNTANMKVGVHKLAVDNAIENFFKDIAKKKGVKILPRDYEDFISVIVSSYSNITSYANQTKDGVSNAFISDLIYNTVLDLLEESSAMQRAFITELIDNVVSAARARQLAKEYEQQQRQLKKTMQRNKAEKFLNCKSKNVAEKELFIVEGDSAMGACKRARDAQYQAILPVMGKTLNCLKASIEKILKNKVISDLISTIGTGADINGSDMFDIDKLQFSKILICTDADVDGYQIRALLFTLFYRLTPELLRRGLVYIVETPLFEIKTSEGSKFAFDIEEKEQICQECSKKGVRVREILRSKGLGENEPEMMRQTTMDPNTRRLIQLKIDTNDEMVREVADVLFGRDIHCRRKEMIMELIGVSFEEADAIDEIIKDTEASLTEFIEESKVDSDAEN